MHGVARGAQVPIWSEMRRCRDVARWRRGDDDVTLFREGSVELDADLQPDAAVPINRDVASALRMLRADRIPHETAALGHDARQLGWTDLPANHRHGNARYVFDANDVRRHRASVAQRVIPPAT